MPEASPLWPGRSCFPTRDADKFAQGDLTVLKAQTVKAPLIEQCIRHYECKVVHYNDVVDATIDGEIRSEAYPQGNLHRIYYGQILRTSSRT